MKLVLFGFGAMNRIVAGRAEAAGHEVVLTVTRRDRPAPAELARRLAPGAVAIDFSTAEAVIENVSAAVSAGCPIVVGTTGWNDRLPEAQAVVERAGGAMVYGANFSIGVNVFYRLVRQAAEQLARAGGYDPFIEEQHHARKEDSPSGTALALKRIVDAATSGDVPVACTRAGQITGTHRVGFDSPVDQVLLTHAARSREGFADGALRAASWLAGRTGVFPFEHVVDALFTPTQEDSPHGHAR
jgi:4-hydroxy-tetrahydrodipicolinate reductase